LQEIIKQLESAIQQRKSTRSFENKNISKPDRQKLEEFIKNIPAILPFEYGANIILGPEDNKKAVFLINTSSDFAAIISNDSIKSQAMAGFAGELFVLYCQNIGISTCWIGAFKRNKAESIISGCCPGYNRTDQKMTGINISAKKILCLVALGYNTQDKGLINKVSKKLFSSKRKSIAESLAGDSLKEFPENIRYGLELALTPPSARNRQYWYFKVLNIEKQDKIQRGVAGDNIVWAQDISAERNGRMGYAVEIKRRKELGSIGWPHPDLDIGIAASHFWLGLKSRDIAYSINIEEKEGRAVWEFLI